MDVCFFVEWFGLVWFGWFFFGLKTMDEEGRRVGSGGVGGGW